MLQEKKFFALKDNIAQIIEYIKQICAPAFDSLKDFFGMSTELKLLHMHKNLLNGIVQAVSFMVAAIEPFVSFIANLFQGLFALLAGDTDGAIESFKNAWSSFKILSPICLVRLCRYWTDYLVDCRRKPLLGEKDMLQNFINGITEKIGAFEGKK